MDREVVMTGVGGQGIQLIAKTLAQAGMREGRQVMMFGLFMGTIRGGSSESTVVLADDEIVAPPIVPQIWSVLAMHPAGLPPLGRKMRPGGVLLFNSTLVKSPPAWDGVRLLGIPATAMAEAMGQVVGAAMIALGALAGATGIVRVESLHEALAEVLPPHRRKLVDTNAACLRAGAEYAAGHAETDAPHAWP